MAATSCLLYDLAEPRRRVICAANKKLDVMPPTMQTASVSDAKPCHSPALLSLPLPRADQLHQQGLNDDGFFRQPLKTQSHQSRVMQGVTNLFLSFKPQEEMTNLPQPN